MSQTPPAAANPRSLLQEYAAEVAPPAAASGPAGTKKAAAAAEPRKEDVGAQARNLEMIMRIPVTVKVILGSTTMPVANLAKLGRGAIIPLDRRVGEPVEVVVNGRVVARGDVVVVDEASSRFGISLTEIVGPPGTDKAT